MSDLPEVAAKPCAECPWKRASARGWLGPMSAEEWKDLVHSDAPIACHLTIRIDESWEGARQCAGAATYRANVAKSPRDPNIAVGPVDRETVFATPKQFLDHHEGR